MPGGKRLRAGRKAVKIDLTDMEKLCGMQATDAELAAFFNVSVRTIERRKKTPAFLEAIERGKARGRLSLRRALFGQVAKGQIAAIIFLSKNLLGYKDYVSNEHSGPEGGPIAVEAGLDLGRLTDEELQQLRVITEKANSRH